VSLPFPPQVRVRPKAPDWPYWTNESNKTGHQAKFQTVITHKKKGVPPVSGLGAVVPMRKERLALASSTTSPTTVLPDDRIGTVRLLCIVRISVPQGFVGRVEPPFRGLRLAAELLVATPAKLA
jgi:hypothetical protein